MKFKIRNARSYGNYLGSERYEEGELLELDNNMLTDFHQLRYFLLSRAIQRMFGFDCVVPSSGSRESRGNDDRSRCFLSCQYVRALRRVLH